MTIPASDPIRRPWSDSDKEDLIAYWDTVGSVVLISILLNRPEGSVQTEASRRNLPRRQEERGRHRKKWTPEDFEHLLRAAERCRDPLDRIKIVEVANEVGRSIDAVITRLTEHLGSRDELKRRIVVSDDEIAAFKAARRTVPPDGALDAHGRIDARKLAMMRKCLTCSRPFWSTSAGNRICPKCHSSDSNDWD